MVLLKSNQIYSKQAFELPEFNLKNIDEKIISSNELALENGILVAFICNHCPYVKAIIKDLVHDSKILIEKFNIGACFINSNDSSNPKYEEDSFENMKKFAENHSFNIPYLFDETQNIAKKFDAVCTPDLFLFIKEKGSQKYILNYKGRLNNFVYTANGLQTSENFEDKNPEMLNYVKNLFQEQNPSMGCSIKWKY
jgi:peroxiredoxin